MADAPQTLKRKRGRPRKSVIDETAPPPAAENTSLRQLAQNASNDAGVSSDEARLSEAPAAIKKPRGRPRKAITADSVVKELAEATAAAEEEASKHLSMRETLAKRAQSHLRDEVQVLDSQALSDDDSVLGNAIMVDAIDGSEKHTAVQETVQEAVAKPRGRPRKSVSAQPATEPAVKRPRGRPRKYANDEERKAVQKRYRETFKARRAALLDQQTEDDEESEVEFTERTNAVLGHGESGYGIDEIIPNGRLDAHQPRAANNTNNDDSILEYESAHEHPPPNQVLEGLKAELSTMNAKLTSILERQKEQEADISDLKKWKQTHISTSAQAKASAGPSHYDGDDNDLQSEDGDVIGGSQFPILPTHVSTIPFPRIPAQFQAIESTRPGLINSRHHNDELFASIPTTSKRPGGQISNKWSDAARKVYACLADPAVGHEGERIEIISSRAALGVQDAMMAVDELERHGFVIRTVDDFTFALS